MVCIDERMDEAAEESNLGLLAEATRAAIDKLQERGDKGFFLMVEGRRSTMPDTRAACPVR